MTSLLRSFSRLAVSSSRPSCTCRHAPASSPVASTSTSSTLTSMLRLQQSQRMRSFSASAASSGSVRIKIKTHVRVACGLCCVIVGPSDLFQAEPERNTARACMRFASLLCRKEQQSGGRQCPAGSTSEADQGSAISTSRSPRPGSHAWGRRHMRRRGRGGTSRGCCPGNECRVGGVPEERVSGTMQTDYFTRSRLAEAR